MRENSNDLLSFKSSFFAQKFKSEATFKNHIIDITFLARKFKSVIILKSTFLARKFIKVMISKSTKKININSANVHRKFGLKKITIFKAKICKINSIDFFGKNEVFLNFLYSVFSDQTDCKDQLKNLLK